MACQRRRQLSTMVPLPGRVVASRAWGQRIRTALELRALEQATRRVGTSWPGVCRRLWPCRSGERTGPAWCSGSLPSMREHRHARLRGIVGRIGVASDSSHPTGDQRSTRGESGGPKASAVDMHESRHAAAVCRPTRTSLTTPRT